jgi:preprotein translocase subunit YajC
MEDFKMFATLAYAQEAGGPAGSMGILGSLLPMFLLIAVFYLLLIRPQQKRQKEHNNLLNALKAGDEIITATGIYARVISVEDPSTFIIELLPNGGKVKIARSGIAGKTNPTGAGVSPIQGKK